jgi:hypothetical protein
VEKALLEEMPFIVTANEASAKDLLFLNAHLAVPRDMTHMPVHPDIKWCTQSTPLITCTHSNIKWGII